MIDATDTIDANVCVGPTNPCGITNPNRSSLVAFNIKDGLWKSLTKLNNQNTWNMLINPHENEVVCEGTVWSRLSTDIYEKNNIRFW